MRPYDLDEIVRTLDGISPGDWRGFFEARVTRTAPRAPMGGIALAGYKLGWSDEPNAMNTVWEKADKRSGVAFYALGISLEEDGRVSASVAGMPAALAGLVPDMKIIAVDGRRYSVEAMHDALARSKGGAPIEPHRRLRRLLSHALKLAAHGGERYPHLERDAARPDLLAKILAPLTPRPPEALMPPPKKDRDK